MNKKVLYGIEEPVKDTAYYIKTTLATVGLIAWMCFATYACSKAADDCANGIARPPMCFKLEG